MVHWSPDPRPPSPHIWVSLFSQHEVNLANGPRCYGEESVIYGPYFHAIYYVVPPEGLAFYSKNGLWDQMKPVEGRCFPLWQLRWTFCVIFKPSQSSMHHQTLLHCLDLFSISTNPCRSMHPNCQLLSWHHLASDPKCYPLNTVTLESHHLTDIRKPRFIATSPMVIPILQRVAIAKLLKGASIPLICVFFIALMQGCP